MKSSENNFKCKSIIVSGNLGTSNNGYISLNNDSTDNYSIGVSNIDKSIARLVFDKNKLILYYYSDPATYVGKMLIGEVPLS